MSRIRGPYVRFCERDEAVTPHPTRCVYRLVLINAVLLFAWLKETRVEAGFFLNAFIATLVC